MKRGEKGSSGIMALLTIFIIGAAICFNFYVGGFCIEYSVEYWGTIVKEKTVDIPKTPCRVAGIFFAQPAMGVALVTWIVSFVNPIEEVTPI